MSDAQRKIESISFAQESAKQIIALCTAIVTLIAGAVSVGAVEPYGIVFWLLLAMLTMLVSSIAAGIFALFALSGVLASQTEFDKTNPLDTTHYKNFGRFQFFSFLAAMVMTIAFLFLAPKKSDQTAVLLRDVSCVWQKTAVTCHFSR